MISDLETLSDVSYLRVHLIPCDSVLTHDDATISSIARQFLYRLCLCVCVCGGGGGMALDP